MASNELTKLVRQANPKKFHRAVKKHEDEHGELPSLEMASFSGAELSGFDFSGINLTNTAFEECTLTECRFDDCPMGGVYLHSCTLLNCHFVGSTGNGLAIDASTLSRCEFRDCSFEMPEWTDSQFNDCEIAELTGSDVYFERMTFKGGQWHNIQLDSSQMRYVTLRDMTVEAVDVGECDAASCYLKEVDVADDELPDGFIEKTGRRRVI